MTAGTMKMRSDFHFRAELRNQGELAARIVLQLCASRLSAVRRLIVRSECEEGGAGHPPIATARMSKIGPRYGQLAEVLMWCLPNL